MVELPQLAKVAISEIHKKQLWANSIDVFISGAEVLQLAFIQSLEDKYPDPIFLADNTGPQTAWVTGRGRLGFIPFTSSVRSTWYIQLGPFFFKDP